MYIASDTEKNDRDERFCLFKIIIVDMIKITTEKKCRKNHLFIFSPGISHL